MHVCVCAWFVVSVLIAAWWHPRGLLVACDCEETNPSKMDGTVRSRHQPLLSLIRYSPACALSCSTFHSLCWSWWWPLALVTVTPTWVNSSYLWATMRLFSFQNQSHSFEAQTFPRDHTITLRLISSHLGCVCLSDWLNCLNVKVYAYRIRLSWDHESIPCSVLFETIPLDPAAGDPNIVCCPRSPWDLRFTCCDAWIFYYWYYCYFLRLIRHAHGVFM